MGVEVDMRVEEEQSLRKLRREVGTLAGKISANVVNEGVYDQLVISRTSKTVLALNTDSGSWVVYRKGKPVDTFDCDVAGVVKVYAGMVDENYRSLCKVVNMRFGQLERGQNAGAAFDMAVKRKEDYYNDFENQSKWLSGLINELNRWSEYLIN